MVHPLILERELRVGEGAVAGRSGKGMTRPRGAAFHFIFVHVGLSFDGNADGREALGVPLLHPFLVSRAAATVDDHDARNLASVLFRQADPREDAGGLAVPRKRIVEDRVDRAVGLEAIGKEGLGRLGAGLGEAEHNFAVGRRIGEQCDGEEDQAKQRAHRIIW